jgi:hypothetical protein
VTSGPSDRIRVRRNPKRGRYERSEIEAILDRALVGHVAFVDDERPVCIPMLCAHLAGRILVHGSRASRAVRVLAGGAPACLTVTNVHGLVLARSVFEHSANYESVVAFGRFVEIDDSKERLAALEALTEKLLPGRWREARLPSAKELKATAVLAMPVEEASAKLRAGPPDDDDTDDAALDVWAGELPILTAFGAPVASPGLRPGIPLPPSVLRLAAAEQR